MTWGQIIQLPERSRATGFEATTNCVVVVDVQLKEGKAKASYVSCVYRSSTDIASMIIWNCKLIKPSILCSWTLRRINVMKMSTSKMHNMKR